MDWYAQTKLGLTRTLSEENVYEDILGKKPQRLCADLSLSGRKGRENGAGCWKHTCTHMYTHTHLKTPLHSDERAGRWGGRVSLVGYMTDPRAGGGRLAGNEWPRRQCGSVA